MLVFQIGGGDAGRWAVACASEESAAEDDVVLSVRGRPNVPLAVAVVLLALGDVDRAPVAVAGSVATDLMLETDGRRNSLPLMLDVPARLDWLLGDDG